MASLLTLQDVQTDSTEAVDVGMVDLCEEANLGWCHGIVIRKEEFEFENSACVRHQ